MFERNFSITTMERELSSDYWKATISYTSGILGLTKKYSQFILLNDTWVDIVTMESMPKYHFLEEPLNNMLAYKKQIESKQEYT